MQKLCFQVQATDLARSARQRAGGCVGLLAGVLLAGHAFSVSASAQPATPAFKPNPVAEEQKKITSTPQTEEEWRKTMSRTAPPHKGCFTAAYPKMEWTEVQCAPVTAGSHFPAQGNTLGNNNTSVASSIGDLSAAIGSFDSVTGVTSETNSISGADKFSLQLNTNFFDVSPMCVVGSNCGWQQFVFGSFGCTDPDNGNQLTDCVYIEYWLRDWPKSTAQTTMCPNGWNQVADGTRTHCAVIIGGTLVKPHQPITSLRDMALAGSLQINSTDPTQNTVTEIFGTGGTMVSVMGGDLLALTGTNHVWTEAEFNVFGQDKASQAQFNPGTTLVVRIKYKTDKSATFCRFVIITLDLHERRTT